LQKLDERQQQPFPTIEVPPPWELRLVGIQQYQMKELPAQGALPGQGAHGPWRYRVYVQRNLSSGRVRFVARFPPGAASQAALAVRSVVLDQTVLEPALTALGAKKQLASIQAATANYNAKTNAATLEFQAAVAKADADYKAAAAKIPSATPDRRTALSKLDSIRSSAVEAANAQFRLRVAAARPAYEAARLDLLN
jgi:hypothetical protein